MASRTKPKKEVVKKETVKKGPGVVETIKCICQRASGTTLEKLVAELVEKFPERTPEALKSTARTQLSRAGKDLTKDKVAGKPTVYYWKA